MSKLFVRLYKLYKCVSLDFYGSLLGFEYVNNRIYNVDKRLIVPLLRKYGARVGSNCDIEVPLIINTKKRYEQLVIGDGCYIGKNVILDIKGGVTLGNNVTISFGSTISSHTDVGSSALRCKYATCYEKTTIEDNVYVGANATILKGVTIGQSSIVCAGSVVTKSFDSNTLIGGAPARAIRRIVI